MSRLTHPQQIDAILPQTQCELCGYKGCMPYANAIANDNAPINLCPPGGVKGLLALAELVNEDPTPFMTDMQQKTKPTMRAVIREAECIGCAKCIKACPVDAILGSGKQMHTVIANECTGCELCIAPCPVDCIDMVVATEPAYSPAVARKRHEARNKRLASEKEDCDQQKIITERKAYIEAAIKRAKMKKIQ